MGGGGWDYTLLMTMGRCEVAILNNLRVHSRWKSNI